MPMEQHLLYQVVFTEQGPPVKSSGLVLYYSQRGGKSGDGGVFISVYATSLS
jgi:hypothetical protein